MASRTHVIVFYATRMWPPRACHRYYIIIVCISCGSRSTRECSYKYICVYIVYYIGLRRGRKLSELESCMFPGRRRPFVIDLYLIRCETNVFRYIENTSTYSEFIFYIINIYNILLWRWTESSKKCMSALYCIHVFFSSIIHCIIYDTQDGSLVYVIWKPRVYWGLFCT